MSYGKLPVPNEMNKFYSPNYTPKLGGAQSESMSGLNKDPGSRMNMVAMPQQSCDFKNQASPLYENLDYYNGRKPAQSPPYYHQLPTHTKSHSISSQDSRHSLQRLNIIDSQYESNHHKAQPQVPVGMKFPPPMSFKDKPPYEAPPVYENIQDLKKLVSHEPSQPGPQVPLVEPKPLTPSNSSLSLQKPSVTPAAHSLSKPVISPTAHSLPKPINPASHSLPKPMPPLHAQFASKCEIVSSSSAVGVTMGQPALATSYQRNTSSYADPVTPPLPTKPKPIASSGKNLLPYNVTPPRPMGPTEAERKIEELTRQLEEEMEKQEEEGEYFGNFM